MTRRTGIEMAYQLWLRQVGARMREARHLRGWTQVQAAQACRVDIKQVQDFEHGRRPLSTRSLFAIALGLQVPVHTLIPTPDEVQEGSELTPQPRLASPLYLQEDPYQLRALSAAGWRLIHANADSRPLRAVAVFDGSAPTGLPGENSACIILAWALPPTGIRRSRQGHFLVRSSCAASSSGAASAAGASSNSYENSWVLAHDPPIEPLLGKIVLLREPAVQNGAPGPVVCRRVGALQLVDHIVQLRLDSLEGGQSGRWIQVAPHLPSPLLGEVLWIV